jgi:tRNA dimethylallyltransferase
MLASMSRKTLCAIVGSTGVGKSQLSINLAKALSGQVINGDSMQVYRGADVLTNKVTKDEIQNIKHHLLGFLDPSETYDVGTFEKAAIKTVCRMVEPTNGKSMLFIRRVIGLF